MNELKLLLPVEIIQRHEQQQSQQARLAFQTIHWYLLSRGFTTRARKPGTAERVILIFRMLELGYYHSPDQKAELVQQLSSSLDFSATPKTRSPRASSSTIQVPSKADPSSSPPFVSDGRSYSRTVRQRFLTLIGRISTKCRSTTCE
jgi:hypothetical protein